MTAFQGRPKTILVHLFDQNAGLAAGLTAADVTVSVKRQGQSTWTSLILSSGDLVEVNPGGYLLTLPASALSVLGLLVWRVSGSAVATQVGSFDVDPQPVSLLGAAPMCVVTGNVRDLAGVVPDAFEVTFRPTALPALAGGTSLVAGTVIRTSLDALGNFSAALLRGATCVVTAEPIGLKAQISVPDQPSATLASLLPPL